MSAYTDELCADWLETAERARDAYKAFRANKTKERQQEYMRLMRISHEKQVLWSDALHKAVYG